MRQCPGKMAEIFEVGRISVPSTIPAAYSSVTILRLMKSLQSSPSISSTTTLTPIHIPCDKLACLPATPPFHPTHPTSPLPSRRALHTHHDSIYDEEQRWGGLEAGSCDRSMFGLVQEGADAVAALSPIARACRPAVRCFGGSTPRGLPPPPALTGPSLSLPLAQE